MLCTRGFRICKILQGEYHKSVRKWQVPPKKCSKSANIQSSDSCFFYLDNFWNAYFPYNHPNFVVRLKFYGSQFLSGTNQNCHVKWLHMDIEQRLKKIVQQWQIFFFWVITVYDKTLLFLISQLCMFFIQIFKKNVYNYIKYNPSIRGIQTLTVTVLVVYVLFFLKKTFTTDKFEEIFAPNLGWTCKKIQF